MKQQEKLTHQELMDSMTICMRDIMQTDISHRNMPNLINRGRAVASIVTSIHREELMEAKRSAGLNAVILSETRVLKGLKPKK